MGTYRDDGKYVKSPRNKNKNKRAYKPNRKGVKKNPDFIPNERKHIQAQIDEILENAAATDAEYTEILADYAMEDYFFFSPEGKPVNPDIVLDYNSRRFANIMGDWEPDMPEDTTDHHYWKG